MYASYWLSDEDLAAIPAEEVANGVELPRVPLVSVLILAYNHEEFVGQAIESVLKQDCPHLFEVLIGEDRSTDSTLALCSQYQAKAPERIRLITATANVGMHRNFARLWHRARGRYVAVCEGDDYWIDAGKLAKQVAMLEARPECVASGQTEPAG